MAATWTEITPEVSKASRRAAAASQSAIAVERANASLAGTDGALFVSGKRQPQPDKRDKAWRWSGGHILLREKLYWSISEECRQVLR